MYNRSMNSAFPQKNEIRNFVQTALIVVLLTFAALVVLQQANPARNKLGRDAGAYLYIGSRVLRGDAPYLTAWDGKPPAIFLLDAFGIWLGRGTRWGVWLVEFISLSGAAFLGFIAMRRQFGVGAALFSSLIWLYGLNNILIGGNLTEEYSLFFSFLSIYFFVLTLGRDASLWIYAGIGISAGISFLFRPNNTGTQMGIILTMIIIFLIEKQYAALIKRLLVVGISALVPLGILSVYLGAKGALAAFWDATIVYNFSYAGAHHFNPIASFSAGILFFHIATGMILIGYLAAATEVVSQWASRSKIEPILLWIALTGLIETMLSGLSGRNYEHYFINWIPFTALATALLIFRTLPVLVAWAEKKTFIFLVTILVLFSVSFYEVPGRFYKNIAPLFFGRSARIQLFDPVVEYVNVNTTPEQTVFVWGGQAGINFLARRDSPVPYLFFPLGVPSRITDQLSRDVYETFVATPPTLVVDGSIYDDRYIVPISVDDPVAWLSEHGVYNTPYLIEMIEFIRENYALVRTVNQVDIYRLNQ